MKTDSLPNTREEARSLGETKYFTGKPCSRGHIAYRFTANGQCFECQILGQKKKADEYRKARAAKLAREIACQE